MRFDVHILSPSLKEHYPNKAFKEQFLAFEGKRIADPERFCPDQGLLEKHRGKDGCLINRNNGWDCIAKNRIAVVIELYLMQVDI